MAFQNDPSNIFKDAAVLDGTGEDASSSVVAGEYDDTRGIRESEEYPEQEPFDDLVRSFARKQSGVASVGGRRRNQPQQQQQPSAVESSVITLYLSGRRPGEFSTVLSTIFGDDIGGGGIGGDSAVQKRDVRASVSPKTSADDFYTAEGSDHVQHVVVPAAQILIAGEATDQPTESLESHVGDVSRYHAERLVTMTVAPIVAPSVSKTLEPVSFLA